MQKLQIHPQKVNLFQFHPQMNVLLVFHPQNPVFVWVYPQKGTSQLKHPQLSKKSFYSPIYEIKPIINYQETTPTHASPWRQRIWQQGWCARITFQLFCEKWTSLIVILVPHNCPCPEGRVCCLFLSLHAQSLLSHRMLRDFPSQICKALFESAKSNSFKNVKKKNLPAAPKFMYDSK